jgi:transcriptional regulator with XRE-family HTH domain
VEISDRIKRRRLSLGLTLEDVAEKLGVAKSTVLRYETKDIGNMGIDKLALLAEVLRCTPYYLMGWEDEVEIHTIAAHSTEDLTKEEQEEVLNFVKYLKSKRSMNE